MSLHRDITDCVGRGPKDHREVFWIAKCDCGWTGGEHPTSAEAAAADNAHREYRQHIEEVLGVEACYDADVRCRNCGSSHRQGVFIGTHVTANACRCCGTRMLEPDNEAWHDSRTESKRWW